MFLKLVRLSENWREILINLLLKKDIEPMVKLRNGLKFYINKNLLDVVVVIENFGGEHNHDYFKNLNLSEKPVIIDVGAHVGSFSIHAANKYPKATIFSFEPDDLNYEKLIKNVTINNIKNVISFHKAVGNIDGMTLLYSDNAGNFGTCGSSSMIVGPKSKQVLSTKLESIFKENQIETCDLLKMDCEGGEYDIILNSKKEIFARINSIILEYHTVSTHEISELEQSLKNYGFQVTRISNDVGDKFGFIHANKLG